MVRIIVTCGFINTIESSIALGTVEVVIEILSIGSAACPEPVCVTAITSIIVFRVGARSPWSRSVVLTLLIVVVNLLASRQGRWVVGMIPLLDLLFGGVVKCCLIED